MDRQFTVTMAFIAMIRRGSATYQRREVVIGPRATGELTRFEVDTLNAIKVAQAIGRDPGPFPGVSYTDGGEAAPELAVALAVDAHARRQPMPPGLVPVAGLDCNGNTRPIRAVYGRLRALPPDPDRVIIVNRENAGEAIDADRGAVCVASTLQGARELAHLHAGRASLTADEIHRGLTWPATREGLAVMAKRANVDIKPPVDFADLRGDEIGTAALSIAEALAAVDWAPTSPSWWAQTVHITIIAPPGAGATAISRRIVGLLPPMTPGEVDHAREVYSRVGIYPRGTIRRPFRSPHHSCSEAGLVGEVSLASAGVLSLEEAGEFRHRVIGATYQAISDAAVPPAVVVRVQCPCPCGHAGHPSMRCDCTPGAIAAFETRIASLYASAPPADLVIRLRGASNAARRANPGPRCPSTAALVETAGGGK